jgi:hypothetical protein
VKTYSPKRRTALVLAGSGTAGAYHAGVLKALDESGVKVDLVVGTGAGTVAAAFAAMDGGERLYGTGGFWDDAGWDAFYRWRPGLRLLALLLCLGLGIFLLPAALALLAGLLFPLLLVVDLAAPQGTAALLGTFHGLPSALRLPYLAALAVPVVVLALAAVVWTVLALARGGGRRLLESFESPLSADPAAQRLRDWLGELAREAGLPAGAAGDEVGRRYVGALLENLGQPGFRELILRAADLDTGGVVSFALLREPFRARHFAFRARDGAGSAVAVDLGAPGAERLMLPALLSGVLLPPPLSPPARVALPGGGRHGGETHRLTDGTVAGGGGLSEALLAGAEQLIVACPVPEQVMPPRRRRGPMAVAEALLATLERQGVERDLAGAERINRMVETLGHQTDDGGRAWEDPATGRLYRQAALYVVRPERRVLGPLDFDGTSDAAREVRETAADLLEQGYRDAYRLFLEPVLGASADTAPSRAEAEEQPIGL